MKLGGLALAASVVPLLVPAALSLAGGILTALGMFLGREAFKTVPVLLAGLLRNRSDLAATATVRIKDVV